MPNDETLISQYEMELAVANASLMEIEEENTNLKETIKERNAEILELRKQVAERDKALSKIMIMISEGKLKTEDFLVKSDEKEE